MKYLNFWVFYFAEDYTNTEYLEMDDEDAKEDEEVIPLEFSSMTKVIRVSLPCALSSLPILY